MFLRVVDSIRGTRKREKQSGIPIQIQTPFCDSLGPIVGVILGANIAQKSMRILSFLLDGSLGGLREVLGVELPRS